MNFDFVRHPDGAASPEKRVPRDLTPSTKSILKPYQ